MQALQQMKLCQPRLLEARSEGYETMTVSSTPLCEVIMQIVLSLYSYYVTHKTNVTNINIVMEKSVFLETAKFCFHMRLQLMQHIFYFHFVIKNKTKMAFLGISSVFAFFQSRLHEFKLSCCRVCLKMKRWNSGCHSNVV